MPVMTISKLPRNWFVGLMFLLVLVALCKTAIDYSGLDIPLWSSESSPPPAVTKPEQDAPPFFARILPLGASIVWGKASSTGNGFRKPLRDRLRGAGWQVNMVGSKKNGDMHDNDVEAHSGDTIAKVHQAALLSIKYQPNIVVINAGTNDCRRPSLAKIAGQSLGKLLDMLYAEIPGVTIILSTLLQSNFDEVEPRRQGVNQQIRHLYEHHRNVLKHKIVLAEMTGEGDYVVQKPDLGDTVHPNDRGYTKMAEIWFMAISEAHRQGFITEPNMSFWVDDENLDDSNMTIMAASDVVL